MLVSLMVFWWLQSLYPEQSNWMLAHVVVFAGFSYALVEPATSWIEITLALGKALLLTLVISVIASYIRYWLIRWLARRANSNPWDGPP
jgi:hypothetical protein